NNPARPETRYDIGIIARRSDCVTANRHSTAGIYGTPSVHNDQITAANKMSQTAASVGSVMGGSSRRHAGLSVHARAQT
ncbi:hypothetical protein, partial [Mesorhizobium sp. M1E.F.Ca.ET.041.01.1.1]|uniref:hypothetical protein n=1 Tax=Mesorhizobium sp. M1E.F.Ca.ET.041.01.1.1 TaxID=2496759 RepID=UPI001AEC7E82